MSDDEPDTRSAHPRPARTGFTLNAANHGQSARRAPVLVVAGELDATNAPDLQAAIEHVHHHAPTVVVDLAGLTFCDHAGLEVLRTQHATLRAGHGELIIRNPSRVITRLLHLSRLEGQLTIQLVEHDRK